MTNIAQMINVLQAMILTDGPKMVRTPTYHKGDRLDGQLLTAPRMDTINSFDSPDVVRPTPFKPVSSRAGKVKVELPAKSVLVLSQR
jgi:alpha-L-arabinofuranosidase